MIIIGERVNSTRKYIREAIDKKDTEFLMAEVNSQLLFKDVFETFIDINCAASLHDESDILVELVQKAQQRFGCSVSLDSPDASVIKAGLEVTQGKPFINSITAEKEKLSVLGDFLECNVIALLIDEDGMPQALDDRKGIADDIIGYTSEIGADIKNIFIDPLVKPISTEPRQAAYFLDCVKILKDKGIKTVGGLSNVSFGLPKRSLLNAVFLKLAIDNGIAAAIIDPTDKLVGKILNGEELPQEPFSIAEAALLGKDEYSMDYITAFRKGKLEV